MLVDRSYDKDGGEIIEIVGEMKMRKAEWWLNGLNRTWNIALKTKNLESWSSDCVLKKHR